MNNMQSMIRSITIPQKNAIHTRLLVSFLWFINNIQKMLVPIITNCKII